jgi:hypothetical protein
MPNYTELYIDQGATYSTVITVRDDNGNPIDISAFAAQSQIRTSAWSSNPQAVFTCDMSDGANGNISMSMAASITAFINPGRYSFDVILNNMDYSIVIKPVEGTVTVNPGVTR